MSRRILYKQSLLKGLSNHWPKIIKIPKNGPKGPSKCSPEMYNHAFFGELEVLCPVFCVAGNLVTLYIFINTTTYLPENDHYN